MLIAPLPHNEQDRLARLREMFVLDSEPEPVFDAIAKMASDVCGVPIALISLIDERRQWFKARVGVSGASETPRDLAFCAHAILGDDLFEVADASRDPRFADNPLVEGDPNICFYAGAPLILPGGERIGTLCVIDRLSRRLDESQAKTLRSLADVATQALIMRRDLLVKALSVRTEHETALAAKSEELADLYDNAPCGYHSLDAEGRFVRINDTALRWLGYSREEVVGRRRIVDFMGDEGQAVFNENFPRLLAEGQLKDIEFDLVGKSGEVRHLIASASVVRDGGGAFLMTRTVSYDMTELKRARSDLARLAEEQRAILDTDLLGIMKLKDRHVTWASQGACHLLGYTAAELVGRPARLLYPDDASYEAIGKLAYPNLRVGELLRTQLHLVRKDGKRLWIDMSATALPAAPDDPLCMLVDITALKRAEEIRIRTQGLEAENRQLAQANRVKGVFLGSMSHELRTPLNAVLGYAHLLQAGSIRPDSPKFAKYLGQIDSSGRHLLDLIDKMLAFAQVESGKFEFNPETVDLRGVIHDALEVLQPEAARRGIEIDTVVDDEVASVVIDELRLMQVISHYVSNAIRFSHPGGRVVIRARSEDATNFRIEVEDRGIGIAEDDLPRLFSAFQQLSEGDNKTHAGTGLSLALTRGLVHAQGGGVGVRSRPNEGSVFFMVLPKAPLPGKAG